jgi:hypothetical protein
MIEGLPPYVSLLFIVTTFVTVAFLYYAVKVSTFDTFPGKLVLFASSFWLVFQMSVSLSGFYQNTIARPPRLLLAKLPITVLTLIHVVRVPVELVLFWLFQAGVVPQIMTYEGFNFDIISGISAPIVYFIAFREGRVRRRLLIMWNIVCLALLTNIVTIAVLSLASPIQRFAFDQPNSAILYFPFVWLPTVIVPIVLFSHLTSLWQLFKTDD